MIKASLADKAHHQIKEWIVRYHIKPGSRIRVKDLSQALSMSQTPVREALSMLEREHFIERRPNQGYRVGSLDLQRVEDLYNVRIILEELAASEAATRIGKTGLKRLAGILMEVEGILKTESKQRILELEQDFHSRILEASGNQPLFEMGQAVLDRIWIVQNINLLTTDQLDEAHPQHMKIFKAIQKGDAVKAAALMKKHLTLAKEYILSRLQSEDDVLSKMMLGFPSPTRKLKVIERKLRSERIH